VIANDTIGAKGWSLVLSAQGVGGHDEARCPSGTEGHRDGGTPGSPAWVILSTDQVRQRG
jgi:hypothetical protein